MERCCHPLSNLVVLGELVIMSTVSRTANRVHRVRNHPMTGDDAFMLNPFQSDHADADGRQRQVHDTVITSSVMQINDTNAQTPMARRKHRFVGFLCCVTSLVATPNALNAQAALIFGGAAMLGTLQTPYIYNCSNDPDSRAFSTIVYAGVGIGPVSATAGYTEARKADHGLKCIVSEPPADGVHRTRRFPRRTTSFWGWSFHLRYAPSSLPLMAYIGTGFEFEGNDFRTLGIALRSRGSLSVVAGVEVLQLRTPYIRYDEAWQNGNVISSVEIERGHAWRKLEVIRIGLEYHWRLTGSDE